jgi:hypothetical protein
VGQALFDDEELRLLRGFLQRMIDDKLAVGDRRQHRIARIVIKARKPLFVGRPVADNLTDVIELTRLAQEHDVPC